MFPIFPSVFFLQRLDHVFCIYLCRPARTDVPSMYAEDDGFSDEFTRSADIRSSRALGARSSSRYTTTTSEGYVQYSQPSLNGTYKIISPRRVGGLVLVCVVTVLLMCLYAFLIFMCYTYKGCSIMHGIGK